MLKRYGEVYLITNLVNGKVYVGQTTQTIQKRWQGHCKRSRSLKRKNYLHHSIAFYGAEKFSIKSLGTFFNKQELDQAEEQMITQYKSLHYQNGYNLDSSPRGTGVKSKETIEKQKESIKQSGRLVPVTGKNLSTGEIVEFNSIAETKLHGFNHNSIYRVCMGIRHHHKGWVFKYKTDKWKTVSSKKGNPKAIVAISLISKKIKGYKSALAASKIGLDYKTLMKACKTHRPYKNHIFYFLSDYESLTKTKKP